METAATLDRFEFIEMSIEPVIGSIVDPSLHAGVSERAVYSGGVSWKGTLKLRANYEGDGQMRLIAAVLGTYTAGPPITATESENGGYWTLFYSRGALESTPLYEQLSDVRFTGFTFSIEAGTGAGAMGVYEFEFIGGTYASGHATIADLPAAPTVNPIIFTQAVAASWCDGITAATGTLVVRPKAVKISYKVPLDPDNFYLSTLTPDAPTRTGTNSCEWEIQTVLNNITPIVAASTGALNTGGALTAKFLTTTTKYLQFVSTTARLVKYSCPSAYGNMVETLGWHAYYNATDGGALKVSAVIVEP
jgi:hypothetical protein